MSRLSPVPPQAFAPSYIPTDRPVYRIIDEKGFFGPDDTMYKQGTVIKWNEEPNLAMEPMNELAVAEMKKFLVKLDKYGREAAEKAGKHYNSLADAHENAYALAQQEGKRVEIVGGQKQIPLMGAKKKTSSIEEVQVQKEVPLMGTVGKLSVGYKNEMVTTE